MTLIKINTPAAVLAEIHRAWVKTSSSNVLVPD